MGIFKCAAFSQAFYRLVAMQRRIRSKVAFSPKRQLTIYYHYLYYKNEFWSRLSKFLYYYQRVGRTIQIKRFI